MLAVGPQTTTDEDNSSNKGKKTNTNSTRENLKNKEAVKDRRRRETKFKHDQEGDSGVETAAVAADPLGETQDEFKLRKMEGSRKSLLEVAMELYTKRAPTRTSR